MTKEVTFRFGALSDPLEKQANDQGFTLGYDSVFLDMVNRSIYECWLNGLCSEPEWKSMIHKLGVKVSEALRPLSKED